MTALPPDPKAARPASSRFFGGSKPAPAPDPKKAAKPVRKPPKKPRGGSLSALSGVLSFLLVGAALGVGAFGWAFLQATKTGPLTEVKIVNLSRDAIDGTIGEQLEAAGVIDSATWFNVITLVDGSRSRLKRGEYSFKAGESLRQIEAQLAGGKVLQHKLPIPEGLTSEQIVQRIRDADFLVGEIRETPKEGSLLPETLDFPRGTSRDSVVKRFQNEAIKTVADIWAKRAPDLPIKSPGELVTLASIVEKETGKADERPHVAGVFTNRLNKHMKLQSDPTIVYGLVFGKGTLGHSLTRAEIDQSTPYNTYAIDGLPPGPICNPGKAALEAAANPLKTRDLYFVADGTGGHAFAETVEQHNKNVAAWRLLKQETTDRVSPEVNVGPDAGAPKPTPTPTGKPHAMVEPPDPRIFGALARPIATAKPGALDKVLTAFAHNQNATEAVLGAKGVGSRSLEDLGAVIPGVTDESAVAADGPPVAMPTPAAGPKDLFDDPRVPLAVADATPHPASTGAHRVFDASEGTPLDPLLNKTWDLNNPQVVPAVR